MADDRELIVEQEDGLAVLRLNRPERLNALGPGILERLASEVPRLIAAPDVRAILITGTGKAFCAGGDVGSMTGAPDRDAILAGMRASHAWLKALWVSEKLVITAVNGVAAGGGFGFALIGDLILVSEAAFFKSAFSSLGAAPDYGLAFTLPRAVGAVRAAEILFGDRRIAAEEALAMGMISQILPAENFAAEALEIGRQMARLPLGAQLTKRLLRQGDADAFERFLETEAEAQTQAFQSRDFAEGVAAFQEKRAPNFRAE